MEVVELRRGPRREAIGRSTGMRAIADRHGVGVIASPGGIRGRGPGRDRDRGHRQEDDTIDDMTD